MSEIWVNETLHADYRQVFKVKEVLFDNASEHQHIVILDTYLWGRVMLLDGIVQTTEKDEFIYHEMFAHVPLISHPNPSSVLIVGGGDGGLLREVLKHESVKRVVLVEIDAAVIDLCSKYLPSHSMGCWQDPRVEVVIADGSEYIRSCDKFDVILSDSTDPIGPGEVLFEVDFYQQAMAKLNQPGMLVTQNGVNFLQQGELEQTYKRMQASAAYNGFYYANVPTYIGGNMSFAWANNQLDCSEFQVDVLQSRLQAAKLNANYYNLAIHQAAFALPEYLNSILLK